MSNEYDDDLDERFRNRLRLWAARALGVPVAEVAAVTAEETGGCGNGTCEYTEVEINVELTDGRRFRDERAFGDYLNEIVSDELDEEGRETYTRPLFKLTERQADQ